MDIVVLELHEEIFVELDVGDDAVHGAVGLPCGLIAVGVVFGIELQPVVAWHTDHGIPSVGLACAGEGGGSGIVVAEAVSLRMGVFGSDRPVVVLVLQ